MSLPWNISDVGLHQFTSFTSLHPFQSAESFRDCSSSGTAADLGTLTNIGSDTRVSSVCTHSGTRVRLFFFLFFQINSLLAYFASRARFLPRHCAHCTQGYSSYWRNILNCSVFWCVANSRNTAVQRFVADLFSCGPVLRNIG